MSKDGKYRSILMFGPPGSGKGTQGQVLGGMPGFYHLSSGDMFRAMDPDSDLGKTFKEYSSQGKLVPDELTVRLWREHVERLVSDGDFKPDSDTLILDGIPRSRAQAEMMQENLEVLMLIHLQASDEDVLVERMRKRALEQHRQDDADVETIRNRFKAYAAETEPVLQYYPPELVSIVDAVSTPLGVLSQVVSAVRAKLEA